MSIEEDDKIVDENETSEPIEENKKARNVEEELEHLRDYSTAEIVGFVGKKTADATNPYIASLVVGAATSIDFLFRQFADSDSKKKKKKKKNKKNKNDKK